MSYIKYNDKLNDNDNENKLKLHSSWRPYLACEFEKSYMKELKKFLIEEYQKNKVIYPQKKDFFSAFELTPFEQVRVVLLGQDPYHGPGQAHGLCFSVQKGVAFPPSLENIFKELRSDLGYSRPEDGFLKKWAQEGVLLLNSVLTVEQGMAGSHQNKGWELFTNRVIQVLNEKKEGLVFILWGAYAQKKASFVDKKKHFVLESPHPSPLSSYRGFFGSKPFSKVNQYFLSRGEAPIDWSLN